MPHILNNDTIDEPVRRFLSELDISTEPAVVEVNGRRVYLLVRPADEQRSDEPWTDDKSRRRHELIDRQLDASLSPTETVELAILEEQFDRYLNRIAPLPIQHVLDVLAQLQKTVATTTNQP